MFKSVFGKYLGAFIAIILVCFGLLLVVVSGIVNQYSASVKSDSVVQVARSLSNHFVNEIREAQTTEEKHGIVSGSNINDIVAAIDLATTTADRLTVILTDDTGKLVATGGENHAQISRELQLPRGMVEYLRLASPVSRTEDFAPLLGEVRLVYAMPIIAADGQFYGNGTFLGGEFHFVYRHRRGTGAYISLLVGCE